MKDIDNEYLLKVIEKQGKKKGYSNQKEFLTYLSNIEIKIIHIYSKE